MLYCCTVSSLPAFITSLPLLTLLKPTLRFQILHSEPTTLLNKVKDWASCKWNILDGFAVILFFVGLGLRLYPITRRAGHVVYCIDVMLWITRLLDTFSVSKHLGPYVVMIGRMVNAEIFQSLLSKFVRQSWLDFLNNWSQSSQTFLCPCVFFVWAAVRRCGLYNFLATRSEP